MKSAQWSLSLSLSSLFVLGVLVLVPISSGCGGGVESSPVGVVVPDDAAEEEGFDPSLEP